MSFLEVQRGRRWKLLALFFDSVIFFLVRGGEMV